MDFLVREVFLVFVRLWCSYRVCVFVFYVRFYFSGVILDFFFLVLSFGVWEVLIMLVEFVLNEFI